MKRLRLFVGGYREFKRPTHPVDASLMQRIEEARARLKETQVKPVMKGRPPNAPKRAA
jgi:hypothetical protein